MQKTSQDLTLMNISMTQVSYFKSANLIAHSSSIFVFDIVSTYHSNLKAI